MSIFEKSSTSSMLVKNICRLCFVSLTLIGNQGNAQATGEWILTDFPESIVADAVIKDGGIYILSTGIHYAEDTSIYDFVVNISKLSVPAESGPLLSNFFSENTGIRKLSGHLESVGNKWILELATFPGQNIDSVYLYVFSEEFELLQRNARGTHRSLNLYTGLSYSTNKYIGIGSMFVPPPDSLVGIRYSALDDSMEIKVFHTSP